MSDPKTEMLGRQRPRASLEDTLTNLCDDVKLNGAEKETMLRLWTRGLQSAIWEEGMVPIRVWRAFYARHPDAMLESRDSVVRARGEQFKAQGDAAAAMSSIDDVLSPRIAPEARPGSTAGR